MTSPKTAALEFLPGSISFLDHHLRCGDSLFGSWVRGGIERASALGAPLLLHAPMTRALRAASKMQIIEGLTDAEIAAFLAELATIDTKSAIVFDDPVSSLDHMHREAVANRLADEGQQRQVIVFTHDIAFLFLLDEACRDPDRNTHFAIRSISKGQDHAGFCNTNPPLKAQPLHTVIESMQTRLYNERILFDRGNQDGWEQTVRSLQEQLRTTWERAVEEALSPVLKRLSNKVTTLGLAKITVITIQDCEKMRAAFGRCSELLHSEAAGLNKPLPAPDKIEAEITTMRDWIASIERRQKQQS